MFEHAISIVLGFQLLSMREVDGVVASQVLTEPENATQPEAPAPSTPGASTTTNATSPPPPQPVATASESGINEPQRFRAFLMNGLRSRCKIALCFAFESRGDTHYWGLEVLTELPTGLSIAGLRQKSSLARYLNSTPGSVSLKGGVRFILPDDWVSIGVYMSTRDFSDAAAVRVRGRNFDYPAGSIRRPYPGAALGLFGDLLWLGFDIEELQNAGDTLDPAYPPNEPVSRAMTFTVALPLVSVLHQILGATGEGDVKVRNSKARRKREEKAAAEKAAVEKAAAEKAAAEKAAAEKAVAEEAAAEKAAAEKAAAEKAAAEKAAAEKAAADEVAAEAAATPGADDR